MDQRVIYGMKRYDIKFAFIAPLCEFANIDIPAYKVPLIFVVLGCKFLKKVCAHIRGTTQLSASAHLQS